MLWIKINMLMQILFLMLESQDGKIVAVTFWKPRNLVHCQTLVKNVFSAEACSMLLRLILALNFLSI